MSNFAVGERAKQLSAIEALFASRTVANPITIFEAAEILGDKVTGAEQVGTYVKTRHKLGKLSRIREGKWYKYWGCGVVRVTPAELQQQLDEVRATNPAPTGATITKVGKTEIHVSDTSVIIENEKCRVVVDLK